MKNRIVSLLLAAVMITSLVGCGSQDSAVTNNPSEVMTEEMEATDEVADENVADAVKPTEPTGQLIIGSITDLTKEFYDVSYENDAFNYKMYDLIHGGGTVSYTKEGKFEVNPTIVEDFQATDNEDGSKTYTMKIKDGLVWSDNSPITAKDYVFALLLENSPEMMGVDNYPANGETYLVGWDEFQGGTTKAFKGVRLIRGCPLRMGANFGKMPVFLFSLGTLSCGFRQAVWPGP